MPLPFREQLMGEKKGWEPLTLKHGENEYKFNCKPCENGDLGKDAELNL
jgi:hypothetical protein